MARTLEVKEILPLSVAYTYRRVEEDTSQCHGRHFGQGLLQMIGSFWATLKQDLNSSGGQQTTSNKPRRADTLATGVEQFEMALTLRTNGARLRTPNSSSAQKSLSLTLPIGSPRAGKKLPRSQTRSGEGRMMVLEERESKASLCVAIYDQPLHHPFRRKTDKSCSKYARFKEKSGYQTSFWSPDSTEQPRHLFVPVHFPRADEYRYPWCPADVLDWQHSIDLQIGNILGSPLPQDTPMELGYDRILAERGYSPASDGSNCATNYRISVPRHWPGMHWQELPIPMPLSEIFSLRLVPEHSWEDVFENLLNSPLTLVREPLDHVMAPDEPEPTAVISDTEQVKIRRRRRVDLPKQPCYGGPCKWTHRIGRYIIFAVERNSRLFYIVDSDWRDQKTALLCFWEYNHAADYCDRKRTEKPFIRVWHTGTESAWMSRLEERLQEKFDLRYPPS